MVLANNVVQGPSLARNLSDGSPDGTVFGVSTSDPIGFYGDTTPSAQPSGNAQALIVRGAQGGVVTTYSTTQTPVSSGVTLTSAEYIATVQTGTGAAMLIASGDLIFVNKPTSQAGLGVGNVRAASSSNTIGVTFTNLTSSSIVPTSSEVYSVVGIRGLGALKLSATLSPASVAAFSTVEQQFTVTGLPAGSLVQVNKPTSQAGLDIGGVRVVSNNLLGITFINPTSSAVQPTSSEAYLVTALPGLDAINNDVFYGFNVGTPGSVTTGMVVSGGSVTCTGVLTTDIVTGIQKPTAQAQASSGIPQAFTSSGGFNLYYMSQATWTPTASEVYSIRTSRLNPAAPLLLYNQLLTPVAVAANTTAEQTFTVTGLVAGTPVWINKPSFTSGLVILGVRVSAANTLAVNYGNNTAVAITPPSETYTIGNFQAPSPGAGNSVYQTVTPGLLQTSTLANGLRNALAPSQLNLIAGA